MGFGVGDEVRRDVIMIEVYIFGNFEFILYSFVFFDGDDIFFVDFFYSVGNYFIDVVIVVGVDGSDLGNFGVSSDVMFVFLKVVDDGVNGSLDIMVEIYRVVVGSDVFDGFGEDGMGEDGSGSGVVISNFVGFGGDIL